MYFLIKIVFIIIVISISRLPENIPYIFGEQDPIKSSDYNKLVRSKDKFQELISLLENRAEIQVDLDKIDIDDVEEKIREIEEEIEEIGLTQRRTQA